MPGTVAAVLLNPDDPLYTWEHANAHRVIFGVMAPLDRFSRLPYLLDPSYGTDIFTGPWNMDHQQAHNDFNTVIPQTSSSRILSETDWTNREDRQWTIFANHMEHYTTNQAISALPATYQFW